MAIVVTTSDAEMASLDANNWEVNEDGGLLIMIDDAVTGEFAPGKWDSVIAINDDELEDFLNDTGV